MRLAENAGLANTYFSTKLMINSFALCINIIVASAYVTSHYENKNDTTVKRVLRDNSANDYCRTDSCVKIGDEMRDNMNEKQATCLDFYGNACGKWTERHPIPDNIQYVEWDEQLRRKNDIERIYEGILTNGQTRLNSEAIQKAKTFFTTCNFRESEFEDKGISPIVQLLENNSGWPLSMSIFDYGYGNYRLKDIHEKYASENAVSAIFVVNSNYPNVYMGKPRLSIEIPRIHQEQKPDMNYYENNTWRTIYEEYIINIAESVSKLTGKSKAREEMQLDARRVIRIEEDLYKISNNQRSKSQRPIAIKDMQRQWNTLIDDRDEYSINWLDVIRGRVDGSGLEINEDSIVILSSAQFIPDLTNILKKHPLIGVVNYVHWRLINELLRHTSRQFRERNLEFKEKLFGPRYLKKRVPLSPCITDGLKHAVHYHYVKEHHNEQTKNLMKDMTYEIREAISNEISSYRGDNDNKVNDRLKEILQTIKLSTDYPAWYDSTGIDKYYKKLTIGSDYFGNILAVRKFRMIKAFEYFKERQENPTFELPPTGYNELYDEKNVALFPVGNLPPPMVDPEWPLAVNYARAGAAIGHEMTRLLFENFEFSFQDYSWTGTATWAESRMTKYKTIVKGFIDQYRTNLPAHLQAPFYYDTKSRTEENIADNGGLMAAFEAFKTVRTREERPSKLLPNFLPNLSDKHLFFYAYANNWCETYQPEANQERLIDDTHSSGHLRTNIPIMNVEDFANIFSCPRDTLMNPNTRSILWS